MWDEWEEDPDDYYNYRHQRRLSDPSANLNNFSRYGWKAKAAAGNGAGESVGGGGPKIGNKARSENEGLDSLASELSEIEAGDLKDGELRLQPKYCILLILFPSSKFNVKLFK